jgi:hypothetical protein
MTESDAVHVIDLDDATDAAARTNGELVTDGGDSAWTLTCLECDWETTVHATGPVFESPPGAVQEAATRHQRTCGDDHVVRVAGAAPDDSDDLVTDGGFDRRGPRMDRGSELVDLNDTAPDFDGVVPRPGAVESSTSTADDPAAVTVGVRTDGAVTLQQGAATIVLNGPAAAEQIQRLLGNAASQARTLNEEGGV